jgi:hypothetical protein
MILSVGYGLFHFSFTDKYTYNHFHSYTSGIPVLLFVCLRNFTDRSRQYYSRFFAWIGQFSLETFILQYHLLLAMDTRGVLIILPGSGWLIYCVNLLLTGTVFLWVSENVASATGEVTSFMVGEKGKRKWYHVFLIAILLAGWNWT